jgi:hypothetical protein
MDPVNIGQTDGKNLVVPGTCARVYRLRVKSAEWALGWDRTQQGIVTIDGVDNTEWRMRWDDELKQFVGEPAQG